MTLSDLEEVHALKRDSAAFAFSLAVAAAGGGGLTLSQSCWSCRR